MPRHAFAGAPRWRSAASAWPTALTPLVALLADEDPEVRQMAAFALGLIGDARAADALAALLADPSPLVKGSAAEALGLIGATGHANAIGEMAAAIVQSSALEPPPSEEDDARRDTPAAAFRLAMTSLVRLQAYEPLASAVLDSAGRPRVRWWPVAFALQRLEDPRAVPALLALSQEAHPYTRAFAAKGLGAMGSARNPEVVPTLLALLEGGDRSVAIEAARSLARLGDAVGRPTARPPDPHGHDRSAAASRSGRRPWRAARRGRLRGAVGRAR